MSRSSGCAPSHFITAILPLAFVLASSARAGDAPAPAASGNDVQRALITGWQAFNDDCRNAVSDDPKACQNVTVLSNELQAQGCSRQTGDVWTCKPDEGK